VRGVSIACRLDRFHLALEVVEVFYAAHFAGDMGFTQSSISAKEQWLAPDLYTLLLAELQRPASPDEAPFMNGDPFTDTQEYPSSFRIGDVERMGDTATVTVHLPLPGGDARRMKVDLVRLEIGWRIADLFYEDGSSLRQLLSRQ